jgi:hypothetical protein
MTHVCVLYHFMYRTFDQIHWKILKADQVNWPIREKKNIYDQWTESHHTKRISMSIIMYEFFSILIPSRHKVKWTICPLYLYIFYHIQKYEKSYLLERDKIGITWNKKAGRKTWNFHFILNSQCTIFSIIFSFSLLKECALNFYLSWKVSSYFKKA